ncbi:beta-galactosidase [Victivallis vadensis]|uniref:beta-galactosidase n=1 Tax=Victivallis vadensis TaxID=172901 RepID=UPI00307E514B
MKLFLIVWIAVCIGVVRGSDFPGAPWLVRGASLRLRHSAEPQAPGASADARVTVPEAGRLAFLAELKHGQKAFIGAAVLPKQGYFDFTGHTVLACEVENRSAWPVDVLLRIHSGPEPEKPTGRPEIGVYLMPGEKRTLRIPLYAFRKECQVKLAPDEIMHGKPFGMPGQTGIDAEHVNALIFWSMTPYLRQDGEKSVFAVSGFRFSDELAPDAAPLGDPEKYFPFVDRYGQYRHADWPGKIHSDEELRACARAEAASWKPRPADWNRYGGYRPGPTLEATGFFRTEKYGGKWYLVDPEGKLFFSLGVNAIAWWSPEFSDGREHYFDRQGEYVPSVDRKVLRFQKEGNIIQWGTAFPWEVLTRRLDSWGINTLGAWTEDPQLKRRQRPYTVILMHEEKEGRFGFNGRDGFDSRFGEKLREVLSERYGWTLNDPMCIGYFVTNEMYYGGPAGWAEMMIKSPAGQPGKQEFRRFLERRYRTVAALNRAWGKSYSGFDAFLNDDQPPETAAGKRDLEEFSRILIRKFFAVSRDVLKAVAPNHLFLGSRFQMSAGAAYDFLAELFPEYCDVASYNCYWLGLDHFAPQIPDMPVMITEFSVGGAFTRGLFYSSLSVSGFTPEERKEALKRYYESALRNPRIVGMHYFCLLDQPLCGRPSDGENMNLGILDSTSRPIPEVTEAIREIAEKAVPYRMNR